MSWKCLLGFHDWDKPIFTRTKMIYKCKRCPKIKVRFIPPKVLLAATLIEVAMHGSVITALLVTGHPEWAQEYAKCWSKHEKEALITK